MSKLGLYIDYFKDKLSEKFSSKKTNKNAAPDYDEIKFENWILNKKDCRFENEDTDDYKTEINAELGEVCITAKRKSVYAWTVNQHFRYEDFACSFTVCFDERGVQYKTDRAGTCAAALLFRYINDGVFYALLISDQGWLRMEAMINGKPMNVLTWTKAVPQENKTATHEMKIQVIALSDKFHILVNDAWFATLNNDIIQSAGKLALAVQNWETFSQCSVTFKNFHVNSLSDAVENLDTDAIQKSKGNYDAHINLANSWYAMGRNDLASAEIEKAAALKPLEAKDAVTAGRIYFAQSRFDDAEQAFQAAISGNSDDVLNRQAIEECASLYYAISNFETLGSFLQKQKTENAQLFEYSFLLQNFAGHYFHWKGEHASACEYYAKAFSLQESEGLFAFNCALEYEILQDEKQMKEWLHKAGSAFLQAENYSDLAKTVTKLESISGDDADTLSLLGKFYFGIENYTASLPYFEKLCDNVKTKDASNWYLYALLVKERDYKKYLQCLKKACSLDKSSSLYFYRLAEAEFYAGIDCSEALEKSLALDDKNAWSYNLRTLVALKNNELENAEKNIVTARKILPDEISLLGNFVEVKRLQGKLDTVLPLFDFDAESLDTAVERNRGEAFHILANALYKEERFESAAEWYNRAEKLLGDNYDLFVNKAQNAMELNFFNEADTLLVKALDMKKTPEVYRLIARLSTLKGNYLRATACIDEALENFPAHPDLLFDLVIINMQFNKLDNAQQVLAKLEKIEKSERVKELKAKLRVQIEK